MEKSVERPIFMGVKTSWCLLKAKSVLTVPAEYFFVAAFAYPCSCGYPR